MPDLECLCGWMGHPDEADEEVKGGNYEDEIMEITRFCPICGEELSKTYDA